MLTSSVVQLSPNPWALQSLTCQQLPSELTFFFFYCYQDVLVIPRIFIYMQRQPVANGAYLEIRLSSKLQCLLFKYVCVGWIW